MEFDQILTKRRSIRAFLDVPVERDKWAQMIEAATLGPSSGNLQNWRFIVTEDKSIIKKIAHVCYNQLWMTKAPMLITVCADTKIAKQFYQTRGEMLYSVQNCAAAIQTLSLKAVDLGLATCWVGAFDEVRLKNIQDIPDHIRPQAIIAVGYADETVPRPPQKKLSEMVSFDTYGTYATEFGQAYAKRKFYVFHQKVEERTVDFVEGVSKRVKEWVQKQKNEKKRKEIEKNHRR